MRRLLAICLMLFTAVAGAASLQWDASENATGYKIHYGSVSGQYQFNVDVGNSLQWNIPDAWPSGGYYLVASAYNSFGESGFSNEVQWLKAPTPSIQPASGGQWQLAWIEDQAMTELISENFGSGAPSDDFNGTTSAANYTGGDLQFSGEGFVLHKTTVGTGDKWMRFKLINGGDNLFFALGDSSGNLYGWNMQISAGNLIIEDSCNYSTYNSYNEDDPVLNINCGSFTSGQIVGVTFEVSTHTLRVWSNVTASAPTSVNSWDSAAADGSSTYRTFKSNSNYVGFGSWTSGGGGTEAFDDFTAGDFAAGGAENKATKFAKPAAIMRGMMRRMWLENDWLKPTGGN